MAQVDMMAFLLMSALLLFVVFIILLLVWVLMPSPVRRDPERVRDELRKIKKQIEKDEEE